jgi:antitoxin (DNA-binding transcriptional repressor) of toxin-antitoxin stability system
LGRWEEARSSPKFYIGALKTQLSKLVDQAAKGEAFVIAKAGNPLVKVAALEAPAAPQRLGFLAGEIAVPDDFNRMGEAEIGALFGSGA